MSQRRIPVARPTFGDREESLVLEALRSGWVTQGPMVERFEGAVARAVEAPEAVAVSSGTTALFLALHALGVGPGDEVIVPSLSFIAIANVVVHCGATPVFADVDPSTYNLDPKAVAAAVTPRTRAVLVAHQLGMPADLDAIEAVASRHSLAVVEDAACALGSRYRGRPIGGSANIACFSFHPRKIVVCGEGGMITTRDAALAGRLRRLRHQGMSLSDLARHRAKGVVIEDYPEIGYNFRLSDIHAAVGVAQMEQLDRFLEGRRAAAARYDRLLSEVDRIEAPRVPDYALPNYQSYIVRYLNADAATRNALLEALDARGVASRRGLMAIHAEPCYGDVGLRGPLPETERAAAQTLILPMYADIEADDQVHVVEALRDALDGTGKAT
ncbi:MAG: DegT/DnrJ/EryC1/StrS family aminotransferase [Deltaproteobacteria bacterium]|nr:DegT/DnrJ/EryC1/StrS family aminotransferase [Deltaproteobacteria bacterium]